MFAKVVAGLVVAGLVGAVLLGAGFWLGRGTAPAATGQGWLGSMMQGDGKMGGPGAKSGAFEVLVDPTTKAVFLEYGPAMMWNTDYGMMGGRGFGMMGSGGMMGGGMMGPGG